MKLQVSSVFSGCNFKVFTDALEKGGIVKALCVPSGAQKFSNTALKKGAIFSEAIKAGAKGLPFVKVLDNGSGCELVFVFCFCRYLEAFYLKSIKSF